MRIADIKKLHKGDEVFWNDPDEGACSRMLKIHSIEVIPPNVVKIEEVDGSYVEVYARELG
jgi:hypothetical protein